MADDEEGGGGEGEEGGGGGGDEEKNPAVAASFLLIAGLAGYGAFGSIVVSGVPCCLPPLSFSLLVNTRTACGIILLNSIVGFCKYGVPALDNEINSAYKITSLVQDSFLLPILASSAIYNGGYIKEIAYANLLLPLLPIITDFIGEEDAGPTDDMKNYISGLQCFIIGAICALEEDYYGIGCVVALACYHFLAKQEKITCIDLPKEMHMNIFMAIATFCMRKGFPTRLQLPPVPKKPWALFPKKKEPCTSACPSKVNQEPSL